MNKILNIFKGVSITAVVFLGLSLFILSHQIGGFRSFVVLSGSMEPTLHVGSLVITEKVSPHSLTPLDIVTFIRPDNPKEFVTHRIIQVTKKGDVPIFSTFGDNNNTIDKWTVVGGAVVGKVVASIPYLGYVLSFTQGKVGIVFLIILPSMMIIADEIRRIATLIKSRQNVSLVPVLGVLAATVLTLSPGVSKTNALMSDSVKIINNSYTVILPTPQPTISPTPTATPTITPTPSCAPMPNVTIEGNGAGSTNSVNINQSCTTSINQQNNSDISTVVHTHVSTGGNTVSNNTSTSTSVSTSSSSSSVSITTVTGSNH